MSLDFGSIIASLLGFASGGWGSFASIITLIVGAFFVYRMVQKAKQEKAKNDSKDQAAVDQATMISGNQQQAGQISIDEAANNAALEAAMKKLEDAGKRP